MKFNTNEVAIIGMSARFPGAKNLDEYWDNLINGRETITHFTKKELQKSGIPPHLLNHPDYVRAKGILENIEDFDADFFGYPPREVERMDPQIRLLHECAWEACEAAGYIPDSFPGRIGSFLGANENQAWLHQLSAREARPSEEYDSFLLSYRDYVSTRISYKLNLKGPSFTLLSACSTSLVAVHLACQSLLRGECEMALAGGASISIPKNNGYLYQDGMMQSRDGHCRAFDADASGTVFGDGVGVVLLKPLQKAYDDGDFIYAVIKGSAINNDGNGKIGYTAPSSTGQKAVIRSAINAAQINSSDISYVETHGTGTKLGDPIEFKALQEAFNGAPPQSCIIGSVKTNIGHVNVAAGMAALIKVSLAIKHGFIPPVINFQKPNAKIDLENSPFFLNTELTEWKSNEKTRYAGVSAFGFGGTNAHLILSESPQKPLQNESTQFSILPISARTTTALGQMDQNFSRYFTKNQSISLTDASFTLATGRKLFPVRNFVISESSPEAAQKFSRLKVEHNKVLKNPEVIFMFPGQGAQHVNMAKAIYETEPIFRKNFDVCAAILTPLIGEDLKTVIYPDKNDLEMAIQKLKETRFAQPAIFTISFALAKLWENWGVHPAALIGHSVGEFVTACLAGVFAPEDALQLIARRGELMQNIPSGKMISIALSPEKFEEYQTPNISLAAINSPHLCVASGPDDEITDLIQKLEQNQIPYQHLNTSHAFHSAMMEPILETFGKIVASISKNPPQIPIISTVTGNWISPDEITSNEYWLKNVRRAVQFSPAIRNIDDIASKIVLEVGPGQTLASLTRLNFSPKESPQIVASLPHPRQNESDRKHILSTLGNLWKTGVEINWNNYFRPQPKKRVVLPTYPFERQRFWTNSTEFIKSPATRWDLLTKMENTSEWFYVPSWKRSILPRLNNNIFRKKLSWLIFVDEFGLSEPLIHELQEKGQNITLIKTGSGFKIEENGTFTIKPNRREDYEQLFQELNKANNLPTRIVHLWALEPTSQSELGRIGNYQNRTFDSLLLLAQVLGKQSVPDDILIYVGTNNLHDVLGSEKIHPEKALILGAVKVIPQEFPNISCFNIDFNFEDARHPAQIKLIQRQFFSEICRNNHQEPLIAFRGVQRWTQIYESINIDKVRLTELPIEQNGCYLITGGLGGLGLVFAEYLAKIANPKLILTSRTPLPPREDWTAYLEQTAPGDPVSVKIRKIIKIERKGAQVILVASDVSDGLKMEAEISRIQNQIGPINGIIHAAGVPGEGIIQLKEVESAHEILASKVQGTLVLEQIFREQPLDFFVLCSSIAAVLGGIGLLDYCAANAFLDAFALRNRFDSNQRFISINWDMWGEVGMGLKTKMPDELQSWLEKELRDGITSKEGVDALGRILTNLDYPNVVVSTRDLQARINLWIKREIIKEKERQLSENANSPKYKRPELITPFEPPKTNFEKKIAAIWSMLFGIEKIGRNDNFYELGGHSLLATTFVNKLKNEIETSLSIVDVMAYPTVKELADLLDSNQISVKK